MVQRRPMQNPIDLANDWETSSEGEDVPTTKTFTKETRVVEWTSEMDEEASVARIAIDRTSFSGDEEMAEEDDLSLDNGTPDTQLCVSPLKITLSRIDRFYNEDWPMADLDDLPPSQSSLGPDTGEPSSSPIVPATVAGPSSSHIGPAPVTGPFCIFRPEDFTHLQDYMFEDEEDSDLSEEEE